MRRNVLSIFKLLAVLVITVVLVTVLVKTLNGAPNFDLDRLMEKVQLQHLKQPPATGSFFNGMPKNVHRKKIDWHDYKYMKYEEARIGIGEHGKAEVLDVKDKDLEDRLFKRNGFNALLSDKISVNRSLPDIRHPGCQSKLYLSELPSVSVVVPFYNEHWSTLLRTAYSVINRSPRELLTEIILVDDCSTKDFLKSTLDKFVEENMPKVRVIHLPERGGLIAARLAGARAATGDVLIFLDSHTEASVNWLPPLLEPIAENYKVCVCPFIDVIAWQSFEYRAQDEGARGAFDWKFFYKRLPLRAEDKARPTEPFASPVMAGGLFAMSSKFFWELGGYDEGLDIWGGEQYELSFKIWQCGGEMYDAPCSRVGHVYRGYAPFDNPRKKDFLTRNFKRVAEVWMDEYKEFLYMRSPEKYQQTDAGDLTEQKAVRERNHCKSFKWFIENIAPDLIEKYPPVEPPDFAAGTIKSVSNPTMCVDTLSHKEKEPVGLYYCAKDHLHPQSNQFFALSWQRDIRIKFSDQCWDVSDGKANAPVLLYGCHGQQGNQLWRYDLKNHHIVLENSNRCLDADFTAKTVFVNRCDSANENQKWQFGSANTTALDQWHQSGAKLL